MSGAGSGSISDILTNIASNLTLIRSSAVGQMVTSGGVVVLAVLLYTVLSKQSKILALVALGWWLAEAVFLAISQIGGFCARPLKRGFRERGSADTFSLSNLGDISV